MESTLEKVSIAVEHLLDWHGLLSIATTRWPGYWESLKAHCMTRDLENQHRSLGRQPNQDEAAGDEDAEAYHDRIGRALDDAVHNPQPNIPPRQFRGNVIIARAEKHETECYGVELHRPNLMLASPLLPPGFPSPAPSTKTRQGRKDSDANVLLEQVIVVIRLPIHLRRQLFHLLSSIVGCEWGINVFVDGCDAHRVHPRLLHERPDVEGDDGPKEGGAEKRHLGRRCRERMGCD